MASAVSQIPMKNGRIIASDTDSDVALTAPDILKSFFGVVEQDGHMVYNRGQERIPHNFFPRPTPYTLINYNLDIVSLIEKYPQLALFGGNLGKVNTYAPLDLGIITGGKLDASSLLQNNNIVCFSMEVIQGFAPKALTNIVSILTVPLALLGKALGPIGTLNCPEFGSMALNGKDLYDALLSRYPGAKKSGFAF